MENSKETIPSAEQAIKRTEEEWDEGLDGTNHWQSGGDNDSWSTKEVVDGHLIMESTRYPEYDEDGRLNSLSVDFRADGSDGLPITPSTYVQFLFPEMSSSATDERWINHALVLYFNNGYKIEYTGDGRLFNWTDKLIGCSFTINRMTTDNIVERFESETVPIPDPLYLEAIQLMQLAIFDSLSDYGFYMDVDAIRLIDTQRED